MTHLIKQLTITAELVLLHTDSGDSRTTGLKYLTNDQDKQGHWDFRRSLPPNSSQNKHSDYNFFLNSMNTAM